MVAQAASETMGVLFVHSCPRAMRPHVEWAFAHALGGPVRLRWSPQPLDPELLRTEAEWIGHPGTAARLTANLLTRAQLRFEVTEEPSPGNDGSRFLHTPTLGIFRMQVDAAGNGVVGEDRLRALFAAAEDAQQLRRGIARTLGEVWDEELEPFRAAAEAPRSILAG